MTSAVIGSMVARFKRSAPLQPAPYSRLSRDFPSPEGTSIVKSAPLRKGRSDQNRLESNRSAAKTASPHLDIEAGFGAFSPIPAIFRPEPRAEGEPLGGVLKGDEDLARLADAFRTELDKMYGYTPDSPVQAVTFRVSAVARFQKPALGVSKDSALVFSAKPSLSGSRRVFFLQASGFADTPVYQRVDLPPGSSIDGSLIVEQMDTTTIVSPGQMATSDECGNLVLRFVEGPGNTLMGWLTCKRPSIIKFEVTSPK